MGCCVSKAQALPAKANLYVMRGPSTPTQVVQISPKSNRATPSGSFDSLNLGPAATTASEGDQMRRADLGIGSGAIVVRRQSYIFSRAVNHCPVNHCGEQKSKS